MFSQLRHPRTFQSKDFFGLDFMWVSSQTDNWFKGHTVYIVLNTLSWLFIILPQVYKKWGRNWKASGQTCRNEEKVGQYNGCNAGTWPRKPVIAGIIWFEAIKPVDSLFGTLGEFQICVSLVMGCLSRVNLGVMFVVCEGLSLCY